jgi:hypothetical protein
MDKFNRENWEKYRRGKKLLVMHSLYCRSPDIVCDHPDDRGDGNRRFDGDP